MTEAAAPDATARFDRARRLHVFSHDEGRFVASGVEFQDGRAVLRPLGREGAEIETHDSVFDAVGEGATVVWEDGGSNGFSEADLDRADARDAAGAVVGAVAEAEGVDPGRIMLVSLDAPATARYFLMPPAAAEVISDG